MSKSKSFLKVGWADAGKGAILAVITSTMDSVLQILQADNANFKDISLQRLGVVATISFMSYILKNVLTNSDDKFLKKEPKDINPYT